MSTVFYVKARSMGYKSSITITMYKLLLIMGKPQIISGDNEIINAFYERGFNFDPEPYVVFVNCGRKFKLLK
jgi:hypothetical protein